MRLSFLQRVIILVAIKQDKRTSMYLSQSKLEIAPICANIIDQKVINPYCIT